MGSKAPDDGHTGSDSGRFYNALPGYNLLSGYPEDTHPKTIHPLIPIDALPYQTYQPQFQGIYHRDPRLPRRIDTSCSSTTDYIKGVPSEDPGLVRQNNVSCSSSNGLFSWLTLPPDIHSSPQNTAFPSSSSLRTPTITITTDFPISPDEDHFQDTHSQHYLSSESVGSGQEPSLSNSNNTRSSSRDLTEIQTPLTSPNSTYNSAGNLRISNSRKRSRSNDSWTTEFTNASLSETVRPNPCQYRDVTTQTEEQRAPHQPVEDWLALRSPRQTSSDHNYRPYRCIDSACKALKGFYSSGGLLRHEREVHGKNGGLEAQLRCPHLTCDKHFGRGFTHDESLQEHLQRAHSSGNAQDYPLWEGAGDAQGSLQELPMSNVENAELTLKNDGGLIPTIAAPRAKHTLGTDCQCMVSVNGFEYNESDTRRSEDSLAGANVSNFKTEVYSITSRRSSHTKAQRMDVNDTLHGAECRTVDTSSALPLCAHHFQHIIKDLQSRVDDLMEQTRPYTTPSPRTTRPAFSRRQSLPLSFAPSTTDDDANTRGKPASFASLRSVQQRLSRPASQSIRESTERYTPVSDGGIASAQPELELNRRLNLRHMFNERATSEPLPNQTKFYSGRPVRGATSYAYGYDGSNGTYPWTVMGSTSQNASQKRKERDDNPNGNRDGRDDESGNGSGHKRPRLDSSNTELIKDRLPCIFKVGDPSSFANHTTKYKHISNLLRHLRCHSFYACSKCFIKFDTLGSYEGHKQSPCSKSCPSKRCLRFIPQGREKPALCPCITTSEQQWGELFRIQYPDRTVPDVFSQAASFDASSGVLYDNVDFGLLNSDPFFNSSAEANHFDHVTLPHGRATPISSSENLASDALYEFGKTGTTFVEDVKALRDRVQILEQRMSEPNEREKDLETVLAIVWQALVRSNSPESQPDSPAWRLMARFAKNVLSTVPMNTSVQPQDMRLNSYPPTGTLVGPEADWTHISDHSSIPTSSKNMRSDSGYLDI